jgi:hypothetical protein
MSLEQRKKAVSIRLGANDLRNIKRLAKRLGVRDSDVIRAAVKGLLAKLAPLHDPALRGSNLIPVFVESGPELFRNFELDAARLDAIINDGAPQGERVAPQDVQLLAMSGQQRAYLKFRLGHLNSNQVTEGTRLVRHAETGESVDDTLRQYLYEKYVYAERPAAPNQGPALEEIA